MLASCPASILNHFPSRLGIPLRFGLIPSRSSETATAQPCIRSDASIPHGSIATTLATLPAFSHSLVSVAYQQPGGTQGLINHVQIGRYRTLANLAIARIVPSKP